MPLDLRKTKCPLNFVKAKLALEKIDVGDVLELWILPHAESALNLPQSFTQEGQGVTLDAPESPDKQVLWRQAIGREPVQIIKVKPRSWINNLTDSAVHNSAFEWSIKDFSLQSHLNSKSINAACICSQVLGGHLITYPGKW